jgi:hypothetical protein
VQTIVRARLLLAAGGVLALIAFAGCGGSSSNGVASKAPNEILAATKAAAIAAQSVHVAGVLVSARTPVSFNLDLVAGKGAAGQVTEHGLSFQVVEVDGAVYIAGSPAFYQHFGGIPAVQLFEGRWLKVPGNRGEFAALSSLTDLGTLLRTLLTTDGTLESGGTTTVGRKRVVAVKQLPTHGTVYVATTGKPYPVEVVTVGRGGGSVSFDHWNAAGPLTPPASAIDVSRLERT